MGKRQNRRSISIRPDVYLTARVQAHNEGVSLSRWTEAIITEALRRAGVPICDRDYAIAELFQTRDKTHKKREEHQSQYFTF